MPDRNVSPTPTARHKVGPLGLDGVLASKGDRGGSISG
ncbi:hypothetical protein VDBG_09067 [Verticillium alfalfae VaMs.102]|uniref:Uncharacterized protein n=1 Tax=Verticillium alfalfae (strain VaMs.102 / ATCC MYA-4576 / FGSC 10136) TaxID=526221 RepID=C9SVZ2_VERA1|nr:hypothetical protein VDBG_09067 [Verticillium alfalfae VaMs.102]EEY22957.1 hypothetical protein VDBG_09067 [Verticillium alfalfae VaMs.102]